MLKLKNISVIIILCCSVLFFTACNNNGPSNNPILARSVSLNVENIDLLEEDTFTFTATVLPENTSNKDVRFYVYNTNVATIDEQTGELTAISAGTTTIVVQTLDGSSRFDYAQLEVKTTAIELSKPIGLLVEENYLMWDEVEDALGYVVNINGTDVSTVSLTQFEIENFDVSYNYKVKAIGDARTILDSEYSLEITANVISSPTNLSNSEDVVSWEAVPSATTYDVWVNGLIINTDKTSLQLDLSSAQDYEIKVKAVTDVTNSYPSAYTESIVITRLETPGNLSHLPGGVAWDTVSFAEHYILEIDGVENVIDVTNYQLPSDAIAKEYSFRVKTVGDGVNTLDSNYSIAITTTKLASPENLRIQNGIIAWDANINASSYSLIINEDAVQVGNTLEYTLHDIYPAATYNITVIANGNGTTFKNSSPSNTINVEKLDKTQSFGVVNGVITWLPVPNATRYTIKFNDTEHQTSDTFFIADEAIEAGEYQISIQAEANGKLDSEFTNSLTVEKLPVADNYRISEGMLMWDSVLNTSYYEVVIGAQAYNAGILNAYKFNGPAGTYDIKVRSIGDSNKYLTSEYTGSISAIKLAQPSNLTLEDGYISMLPVPNASNYVLEVDGTPYVINESAFPFHLNETPGQQYDLRLYAKGDSIQYLNSNYTETLSAYQLNNITNFKIEFDTLKWDSVQNVTQYEVWIKPAANSLYDVATDLTLQTETSFDLTTLPEGSYNVKIIGQGDTVQNLATAATEELSFVKLAKPANFKLSEGKVVWSAVQNAIEYQVYVNDNPVQKVTSPFYTLEDTFLEGTYTVKVKALGNNADYIDSEFTDEVTADKIAIPQNVRVTNGALEWDPVQAATTYFVKIDGEYYTTDITSFVAASGYSAGNYDVRVYAFNGTSFMSNASTAFNVEKLSAPVNLRIENGIIKWNSVLNGTGYKIFINDDVIDINDSGLTTYDLSTYEGYGVGSFNIKVLAVGDSINKMSSDESISISITVMNYAQNLGVTDGKVSWNSVAGATSYELSIEDSLSNVTQLDTGNVTQFLLDGAYESGTYAIKIKAIGDGINYITSVYSPVFSVQKLDFPLNLRLNNGLIEFDSVTNAVGYEISANGEYVQTGISTLYELGDTFTSDDYDLQARAIGDNTIYLTSNPSPLISATKLNAINNFRVEDGMLKWTANSNASDYILNINGGIYNIGIRTFYELPDNFAAGNYDIKIKAQGTSSNYLNSNYSEALNVNKMDEVTSFRVENGVIKWNGVNAPDGYTIIIEDDSQVVVEEILSGVTVEYQLNSSYPNGNYLIYLKTNGNSDTNLDSKLVGSGIGTDPLSVTKLAKPSTITLSENAGVYSLSWEQIAGAINYNLIITKEGVEVVNSTVAPGQSYVITESIDTGEYFVTVKALGDNVDKLNSDVSDSITIRRPSTPTNLAVNNGLVTWDASQYATEYKLNMVLDGLPIASQIVTDTYYYLEELGSYEITVSAYYSGSLPSEETDLVNYEFDIYQSGNGSQASPFEITNETQLENVKYNPTAHYILTSDITLSSSNFEPIGNQFNPFTGSFEGNYYYINNLSIENSYEYSGMFGYVNSGAVIKNFTINNASITSPSQYTGAVAGYSQGLIQNISVNGTINPQLIDSGKALYAGGVVGYNIGQITGAINNALIEPINTSYLVYAGGITAYNNGLITQSGSETLSSVIANYAGGVAGYNDGNIEESYNKGSVAAWSIQVSVSTKGYAGGIVGFNLNTDAQYEGLVINCYNTGTILSTSDIELAPYAGGIVAYNGYLNESSYGIVTNSYSSGSVDATSTYNAETYAGGVTGFNNVTSNLSYSYYLNGSAYLITNGTSGTSCLVKTDSEMKQLAFASLLNLNSQGTNIWDSVDSSSYPKLSWE